MGIDVCSCAYWHGFVVPCIFGKQHAFWPLPLPEFVVSLLCQKGWYFPVLWSLWSLCQCVASLSNWTGTCAKLIYMFLLVQITLTCSPCCALHNWLTIKQVYRDLYIWSSAFVDIRIFRSAIFHSVYSHVIGTASYCSLSNGTDSSCYTADTCNSTECSCCSVGTCEATVSATSYVFDSICRY